MNNDYHKYRVWSVEEKQYVSMWVFVNYLGEVCRTRNGCIYPHKCEVEECTGLKDKNGTLIYEGDVVLFVGKVNLAVQYTPNEWEMAGDDVNVPLTENTARFVKIVGNIHEEGWKNG